MSRAAAFSTVWRGDSTVWRGEPLVTPLGAVSMKYMDHVKEGYKNTGGLQNVEKNGEDRLNWTYNKWSMIGEEGAPIHTARKR